MTTTGKRERINTWGVRQFYLPRQYNLVALFAFALPPIPVADDVASRPLNYSSRYVYGFVAQNAAILGSQDNRYGFGVGLGYGRAEPKLSLQKVKAQLVYEGYYDQTSSHSNVNPGDSDTYALGLLASGRWFWPRDAQGRGMYAELGWGLQYANETTFDLGTHVNSTPIGGFGALFPMGGREFTVGIRLLHISNAGTDVPNHGQNEFLLMLGVRI